MALWSSTYTLEAAYVLPRKPLRLDHNVISHRELVLTRHFVWRQARTGLITPATRSVVLLSEIPGEVGEDVARQVVAVLVAGLRDHFGAAPSAAIVDADSASWSW